MTSLYPAAKLPDSERQNMAVQALAGSVPVNQLALQHDVSRKFVYQQANKASAALAEVFSSRAPDDEGILWVSSLGLLWGQSSLGAVFRVFGVRSL